MKLPLLKVKMFEYQQYHIVQSDTAGSCSQTKKKRKEKALSFVSLSLSPMLSHTLKNLNFYELLRTYNKQRKNARSLTYTYIIS